jgi:hypothetical protein
VRELAADTRSEVLRDFAEQRLAARDADDLSRSAEDLKWVSNADMASLALSWLTREDRLLWADTLKEIGGRVQTYCDASTLIQSFVTARGGIPSHADYLKQQDDECGITPEIIVPEK